MVKIILFFPTSLDFWIALKIVTTSGIVEMYFGLRVLSKAYVNVMFWKTAFEMVTSYYARLW